MAKYIDVNDCLNARDLMIGMAWPGRLASGVYHCRKCLQLPCLVERISLCLSKEAACFLQTLSDVLGLGTLKK